METPNNTNDTNKTVDELSDYNIDKLKKKLVIKSVLAVLLIIFASWFYVHGESLFFQDTKFLMNTSCS